MKLSEKAQEYADWLASRGTFEHSETLVGKHRTFGDDGGPCGENMVYSEGREGAANMSGNIGTSTLHCTYKEMVIVIVVIGRGHIAHIALTGLW